MDDDIVCSSWKHEAARKSGLDFANLGEHLGLASSFQICREGRRSASMEDLLYSSSINYNL